MTAAGRPPQTYRFGLFEVDERRGDILKQGSRMRLRGRPYDILLILLDRPGELITREELRSRLWSSDTFVDFDHGLNASVNRLRDVLGDSAETPRFIETISRRGYRFMAPVTAAPSVSPRPSETSIARDTTAIATEPAVPRPRLSGHLHLRVRRPSLRRPGFSNCAFRSQSACWSWRP